MKIIRAKIEQAEEISKLRVGAIKKFNSAENSLEEMEFLMKRNTPEMIEEKIDKRDVFVAVENGKVIGAIELNDNEITALYVDSEKTRKGIGSKLIKFMEKYAREKKGLKKMNICSTEFGLEFYKKQGYNLTKTEKRIISGIMMTKRVMEKELESGWGTPRTSENVV